MPNPTPGTILGAYRVEGTIGSGSMGEVFKGIDTGLNRRVAIKILSEKHRDSPELRARFVREGRAVAAISHPNVVAVFATGQFDERPYIAMEFLDGTDLGSMVEKGGPLDALTAAHVLLDSAQGLNAAAKAGLIHRDVKPSNLVRLTDGKVKVTDFGLAKPVDPGSEPSLTAMGVVVGTPDYIAPEQARGETIDERVDIYALGGTLYFLLTGIPPFRTGKPAEDKYLKVVARHLRNPPPDAMQTNPRTDRELAALAIEMMAKKPDQRPTYDELVERTSNIVARLDPDAVPKMLASRERSRPIPIAEIARQAARAQSLADQDHGSPTVSDGDLQAAVDRAERADRAQASRFPGWLVVFTILCVGLFGTGLAFYLRAPKVAPVVAPAKPSVDAGVVAPASSPDARPVDATIPKNMLLVRKPDGTPRFYVDAQPTQVGTFRETFAKHEQVGKPEDPVVGVTYNVARSYVKTKGGRLLTSDEWTAASVTPGFVVVDGIFEWVDSPDEKKRQVRQHGKTLVRPDKEQPDVTFRMARDP
ncbi:MAG: serine/threonine-protein kinase [Proteobacteria bacterium]|nr:serine/threonine-protein kinase [Pseudomonadota bacterium]